MFANFFLLFKYLHISQCSTFKNEFLLTHLRVFIGKNCAVHYRKKKHFSDSAKFVIHSSSFNCIHGRSPYRPIRQFDQKPHIKNGIIANNKNSRIQHPTSKKAPSTSVESSQFPGKATPFKPNRAIQPPNLRPSLINPFYPPTPYPTLHATRRQNSFSQSKKKPRIAERKRAAR